MLLDALTIFFLVAGSLLLWVNIWRDRSEVILTKFDDDNERTLESIAQSIRRGSQGTALVKIQPRGYRSGVEDRRPRRRIIHDGR
jgi:hypothetical protein